MTATESLGDFLRRFVSNYDELSLLLRLASAGERAFSRVELGAETELSLDRVDSALAGLVRGESLVEMRLHSGEPRYRFHPRSPSLAASVQQLRIAYDERRLEVVQIMSANALQRVRTTAAWRLKEAFRPESGKK